MRKDEVAALLGFAAIAEGHEMDPSQVEAWHLILADTDAIEARERAIEFYRTGPTRRMLPQDVAVQRTGRRDAEIAGYNVDRGESEYDRRTREWHEQHPGEPLPFAQATEQ